MASSLSSPFEIKCSHPVQPSPSFDSLFFEYLSTVRDKKFPRKSLSLSLRRGIPPYTRPRHIRPCSVNGENFYNLGRSREKVERRLKWRNIRQISHLAPAYINPLDPLFNCLSLSLSSLSSRLVSFLVRPSPSDVRSSMVTRARTRKIFSG